MSVVTVAGLSIVVTLIIVLIKEYRPEFALAIGIFAGIMLLLYGIISGSEIISSIKALCDKSQIPIDNIMIVIKAVGICYICGLSKDIAIDAGQNVLADKIDFIGKIAITALSLPFIMQIVSTITEILQ